jgi:lipid II:glycine glycyltransferase (peptidoglycan interpeptide bridge formation enzyme)
MDISVEKAGAELLPTAVLQQTSFWSDIKNHQGINSAFFDIKARASDIHHNPGDLLWEKEDLLVLFQKPDKNGTICYVPYGPEIEPDDELEGNFLEELSETLRPYLPDDALMIRYDLLWESPWAREDHFYDQEGNWIGPPEKQNQELRINFNTHNWNLKKANTNILPSNTIFLDLTLPDDQLLGRMRAKTRYNIGLSCRKGVRVREGDIEDLPLWYRLYRETCSRNRIFLHDIKYFRDIFKVDQAHYDLSAKAELLIAEKDGEALAAMFLVYSGKRATYLYGASSSGSRNLMATYALQWEAITRAKRYKCTEYDMFGVSPSPNPAHPLYGLYRFKSGFGGELFHRMGCWDYPLDLKAYNSYTKAEINSQGYHLH